MRTKLILLLMLLLVGCNMDVVITTPSSGSGSNVNNNQPTVPANTIAMPTNLPSASVVKVVDGDTIDISLNGQTSRVRMIGINTPESVDPRRNVQCFGTEASNRLKQLLSGQTVFFEDDPS